MLEYLTYLPLAFVGGVILNVMPCVLPVLTLKAFHAVDQAQHDAGKRRRHGLGYTAGTVSLFVALSIVIVAFKASGRRFHWGETQFQNPVFVAVMTAIIFAFALNALGVFEILIGSDGEHGDEDTVWGSVVNGWFAALMSTPCSAPFLGTATVFALGTGARAWQTIVIFAFIGLGLATPYLLLTLVPAFSRLLPRPGAWMETFKQIMGFSLLATAIWLFGTFQAQVTPKAANGFLFFLLALAIALWGMQQFGGVTASNARRWAVRFVAVAALAGVFKLAVQFDRPERPAEIIADVTKKEGHDEPPVIVDGHIAWTPYNDARLKKEHARNRPIFVDFTAEWCASCKANEKAFLESDRVRGVLEKTRILPMKADMTNENADAQAVIDKLGRDGIPDYVIFFPDGTFDLLPQVITADVVSGHLEAASKKYPAEKYATAGG